MGRHSRVNIIGPREFMTRWHFRAICEISGASTELDYYAEPFSLSDILMDLIQSWANEIIEVLETLFPWVDWRGLL